MIRPSDNLKRLPKMEFYLIQKNYNIKLDSLFIRTYDLIIELLNNKSIEEIEKIIDYKFLFKNKDNEIYDILIEYKKLVIDNKKLVIDNKKLVINDKKLDINDKKLVINDKKLDINDKKLVINDKDKKIVYKKKKISATLKRLVWNKWIGEEIGKFKCLCCNSIDIYQLSFNCGHIIPECKGGETILTNLKPICQNCNSSMGSMNMNDFMKTFL